MFKKIQFWVLKLIFLCYNGEGLLQNDYRDFRVSKEN